MQKQVGLAQTARLTKTRHYQAPFWPDFCSIIAIQRHFSMRFWRIAIFNHLNFCP
jgi:hypothetical protein